MPRGSRSIGRNSGTAAKVRVPAQTEGVQAAAASPRKAPATKPVAVAIDPVAFGPTSGAAGRRRSEGATPRGSESAARDRGGSDNRAAKSEGRGVGKGEVEAPGKDKEERRERRERRERKERKERKEKGDGTSKRNSKDGVKDRAEGKTKTGTVASSAPASARQNRQLPSLEIDLMPLDPTGARSSDRDSSNDGLDQLQRVSQTHRPLSSLEELRRPSVDTDAGSTPRALPSSKDGGGQKGGEFPFMGSLLRILSGPTGACHSATPAIEEEEETGGSQAGDDRSSINDKRTAVALTIMCHSAKLSSAAKHTVCLGKDATVQDLCVEFAREIPDGLVVCEVPGMGFTTTFLITPQVDAEAQGPLNQVSYMQRPVLDLIDQARVLHAFWAPTSRFWPVVCGNVNSGDALLAFEDIAGLEGSEGGRRSRPGRNGRVICGMPAANSRTCVPAFDFDHAKSWGQNLFAGRHGQETVSTSSRGKNRESTSASQRSTEADDSAPDSARSGPASSSMSWT